MMKKTSGCFYVASAKLKVFIKVEGYATLNNSFLFKEFVETMLQCGHRDFIIDLSLCKGMDSTFIGILAGIHAFFDKANSKKHPRVTLINVSTYNQNLLDGLGISQILNIKKDITTIPHIPMKMLQNSSISPNARIKMIQQAHQNLSNLNDTNKQKFADFLAMIEQELEQEQQK